MKKSEATIETMEFKDDPNTTSLKTGTLTDEFIDFRPGLPEPTPKLWVQSTAHWYGIWNLMTKFLPVDKTFKADAAESFLVEAFFLGWDFGDDWSPLTSAIVPNFLEDWRMNRRDGIIIVNYKPVRFIAELFKGTRMVYRIHETQESRDREADQLEKLQQCLGKAATVKQAGKFCGWDAVICVPGDTIIKGIVEIKTRNYPKQYFNKNGLVLTKRKWDGLLSYGKTYGAAPLLMLCTSDGMFYLNLLKVDQSKVRVVLTTNDRYDVPKEEEAVIIPGLWFEQLGEVSKEFVNA